MIISIIRFEKINLREIKYSDLPKMMEWRNKDEIRKWFFDETFLTMEKQKHWYENYLKNDSDLMFIIETKEGIPIGTIGLQNIDKKNRKAEFGRMMIGEESYLGKGLASAATKALLNFAFDELNMNKIYLFVRADNLRVIRLYERCNFIHEGVLREYIFSHGEFIDVAVMSIFRRTRFIF